LRSDESRFLLNNGSFDFFSRQNEGKEGGLAPAALVCGQMRETVSAIDEFFNGEQQKTILSQEAPRRAGRLVCNGPR
jgi:hypothetical protein